MKQTVTVVVAEQFDAEKFEGPEYWINDRSVPVPDSYAASRFYTSEGHHAVQWIANHAEWWLNFVPDEDVWVCTAGWPSMTVHLPKQSPPTFHRFSGSRFKEIALASETAAFWGTDVFLFPEPPPSGIAFVGFSMFEDMFSPLVLGHSIAVSEFLEAFLTASIDWEFSVVVRR
jgi:hypothetical protein